LGATAPLPPAMAEETTLNIGMVNRPGILNYFASTDLWSRRVLRLIHMPRYLAGDPVNLKGSTDLNPPDGDIGDPTARITPYKLHRAVQPADTKFGYLIIPKLWGGFWNHFDWVRAAKEGMTAAGMDFSGKIQFVNTTMHWRINHGVVPKSEALSCTDCHAPNGVMDFKALGYADDPVIAGGRDKGTSPLKSSDPSSKGADGMQTQRGPSTRRQALLRTACLPDNSCVHFTRGD
ncbi:MAG: hypothetical protein JRH13_16185, partial [Deltaproteobacteria bacterium]|nr:hypothetical protein [Deltaproteobacteria bacterium]